MTTTEPDEPERGDAAPNGSHGSHEPAGRRSGRGSAELWGHIQRDEDSKSQDDAGREVIGRVQQESPARNG